MRISDWSSDVCSSDLADLVDWRQSPGDVNSRGGMQSRALNARPRRPGSDPGGGRYGADLVPKSSSIDRFPNRIQARVRDNGDLELAAGDRMCQDDFGDGWGDAITGEGAKRVTNGGGETGGEKKRKGREARRGKRREGR